jgi:YidC/Oxa1 family membrane protein insertase
MFQTLFYQPVLNLLIFLYNIVPGNDLGIAIILLTIVIKAILYPLARKAIESQKAMQELQPKLAELKKKYANDKEKMSREMMELYKNNKVNPFSSCLPLLIQMPFLFAVFRVFRDELSHSSLDLIYPFIHNPEQIKTLGFGFLNLSQSGNLYLAILVGVAQFWQGKMMIAKRPEVHTKGSRDEDMAAIMNKQMTYMMPLMIAFFSYSFPAGLALYWLTNTLLTGFQQLVVFRKAKKETKIIEGEVVKE